MTGTLIPELVILKRQDFFLSKHNKLSRIQNYIQILADHFLLSCSDEADKKK